MFPKPPGVVFDCNIYVQMLLNLKSTAFRCFELVVRGEVELFVSKEVLAEVAEVLSRPRFKTLVPDLTEEKIEAFLLEVAANAVEITNVPKEFQYERDPDDEPYINLAIAAPAKFLVSLDNDLLDLMKDESEKSREFRRRFPMIKTITPNQLYNELQGKPEYSN